MIRCAITHIPIPTQKNAESIFPLARFTPNKQKKPVVISKIFLTRINIHFQKTIEKKITTKPKKIAIMASIPNIFLFLLFMDNVYILYHNIYIISISKFFSFFSKFLLTFFKFYIIINFVN